MKISNELLEKEFELFAVNTNKKILKNGCHEKNKLGKFPKLKNVINLGNYMGGYSIEIHNEKNTGISTLTNNRLTKKEMYHFLASYNELIRLQKTSKTKKLVKINLNRR